MAKWLKLLLILFVHFSVNAEGKEKYYYLEDFKNDSTRDLSAVINSKGWKATSPNINLGFRTKASWIMVKDDSPYGFKDKILLFENAHLDSIVAYFYNENLITGNAISGDQLRFKERYIRTNYINLKVPDETDFVLLYVKTEGPFICPVKVYDDSDFLSHYIHQNFILGGYFCLIAIVILINFFIAFWLNESLYIYYSLYLFCIAFITIIDLGLGFEFLWPENPGMNSKFILFGYLSCFSSLLFTEKILNLKILAPSYYKIYSKIYWFLPLFVLSIFVYDYRVNVTMFAYFFNLIPLLCLVSTITIFRKYRSLFYRFFLVGWIVNVCGIFVYIFVIPVDMPSTIASSLIVQISTLVQIFFFNLAVFSRIKVLKEEKEHILMDQNRMLEENVKQRTIELENSRSLIEDKNNMLVRQSGDLEAQQQALLYQNNIIAEKNILLQNRQLHLEAMVNERTKDLKESEGRFRFLAETIPALIWIVIPGSSWTVEYVNNNWTEYTGLSAEEINSGEWKDIVHPDDVKGLTDSLNATIDQKQSFKVILRLMRAADKAYRWHISSCYPHKNEQDNILRWYFFSVEIHEEKVAQENLEKLNYQLRLTNSDLDDYIYTASHELRVPLANIQGLMSLIQSDMIELQKPQSELPALINLVCESLDNLKQTISYLAEISVYQKYDGRENYMDPAEVVDEVLAKYSLEISEGNIEIRKDYSNCRHICFSRGNAERIISALISNAILYRNTVGRPFIEIKCSLNEKYLLLSIIDNGIGIEEKQHEKVFKIFKRVRINTEGAGVGLYIAKRIIENVGGKIKLESKLREGSTFTICFPLDNPGSCREESLNESSVHDNV